MPHRDLDTWTVVTHAGTIAMSPKQGLRSVLSAGTPVFLRLHVLLRHSGTSHTFLNLDNKPPVCRIQFACWQHVYIFQWCHGRCFSLQWFNDSIPGSRSGIIIKPVYSEIAKYVCSLSLDAGFFFFWPAAHVYSCDQSLVASWKIFCLQYKFNSWIKNKWDNLVQPTLVWPDRANT